MLRFNLFWSSIRARGMSARKPIHSRVHRMKNWFVNHIIAIFHPNLWKFVSIYISLRDIVDLLILMLHGDGANTQEIVNLRMFLSYLIIFRSNHIYDLLSLLKWFAWIVLEHRVDCPYNLMTYLRRHGMRMLLEIKKMVFDIH